MENLVTLTYLISKSVSERNAEHFIFVQSVEQVQHDESTTALFNCSNGFASPAFCETLWNILFFLVRPLTCNLNFSLGGSNVKL
jgi:hypothetical protein